MNRRERRHMQKQLGLNKHYKNETRAQKWERWRDNRESGQMMHNDHVNATIASIQEQEDQKMSDVIQSLAEHIAKNKQIPVMDAMLEAKEQYEKSRS
jgi:hypothetical protein